ncbi:hypothetical protein DER46DRAFT_663417 [Fusarium sp. MPI-SDFR-AT-0072]|nr:hypothetical protein DER46DRAFT_663417 [Fusarium sp. MPI-SDFR-AT-0072]
MPGFKASRRRATDAAVCGSQNCPKFTYNELWELKTKFWDNFLYPANLEQAKAVNSTLFAENVQGRVGVTRNFPGRGLNTGYLFGLFTDPNSISLLNLPVSYEITEFTANDYIAAATTVVMFNSSFFEIKVPVMIETFIAWNDRREIVQYDSSFRWFGFLLDTLVAAAARKLGSPSRAEAITALTYTLATGICQVHDKYCTVTNRQYGDNTECMNFLTGGIRFGQDYELGRNTLLCRSVHQQMVQYRPDVHCPHIGPSGGGMCVNDQTYGEKVLEKYFTNAPFVSVTS